MGVLTGKDIYSSKWITADITDSAHKVHFVPIKYVLGDYFLADINNRIYLFRIDGARIFTWEKTAELAYSNMTKERADVIAPQILQLVKNFKYSIDGKSSETRRDKNNAQSSLVDKLVRNKQERIISLKGEVGHSLMDAIRGKNVENEVNNED